MLKKIISCFLLLIIMLSAVACSGGNAPKGMKSATLEGEYFTLYIPESWIDNTASGTSGGYYSAVEFLSVHARYRVLSEGETLDLYAARCLSSAEAEFASEDYKALTEAPEGTTLDGKNALSISYTLNKKGSDGKSVKVRVIQVSALHKGGIVSLYTYCPDKQYKDRSEALEAIRSSFKLTDGGNASAEAVVDKSTPKGMQLASDKGIEYRFYVPLSWECNAENSISEAYVKADNSSVTVTSYTPDGDTSKISAKSFFEDTVEPSLEKEILGYKREGEPTKRKISGYDAYLYTYTTGAYGKDIKILQAVIKHASDSTYYSITYTAEAAVFDSHMEDVGKIFDNFKFR